VTIVYNDYAVRLMKKGIYRFDSEPAQLRVYDGEAQVQSDGKIVAVMRRMMAFSGEMASPSSIPKTAMRSIAGPSGAPNILPWPMFRRRAA
jgi:hypothetical protein